MVPGGDVGDLVADDARQLGLAIEIGKQAAIDVNEAARQCKGVQVRCVYHGERPLEVRHVAVFRQLLADTVDVGLQFRIVIGGAL